MKQSNNSAFPLRPWPKSLLAVLVALLLLGTVSFLVGIAGGNPARAWQIYLVNYLFWSGLAVAGVMMAAIWKITNSVWGRALQGVALATFSFVPAAWILFLPLIAGGEHIFPWIRVPVPLRAAWLNAPSVFARDGLSLMGLFLLSGVFVYYSLRPAAGALREVPSSAGLLGSSSQAGGSLASFLTRGWQGFEAEQARCDRLLRRLAPPLLILYALVLSLVAFDLVMSLDPLWYSTLFGGYYFFGNLYAGLAWVAVLTVFLLRPGDTESSVGADELHQLGKLIFAFCMFLGCLFWSQYLVHWYGNLPEEIEFVIVRARHAPWPVLTTMTLVATLVLPFIILLSRKVKQNPRSLAAVSLLVVVGMWLERFVLVVPSIWREAYLPLGWLEFSITGGFLAATLLCLWAFRRALPFSLEVGVVRGLEPSRAAH